MEESNVLERYPLRSLAINWQGEETVLHFTAANLYVDTSDLTLGWFIDAEGLDDSALLRRLADSPNIHVVVAARAEAGPAVSGAAYFHPNVPASAAAIKGEGELYGYTGLKMATK